MKKVLPLIIILLAVCLAETAVKALEPGSAASYGDGGNWKKAKNNSWPGVVNEKTYWYKLDKSGKLWWSADGKKWEEDSDGMWADKEGSFFKLDGNQLVFSPDAGQTWSSSTPEWKWQAVDGQWYKLDKEWNVWVSK